ncbi:hypothetical protein BGX23_012250 [Mortierella sp. AD031]|nr:hypothetical protein BGX23_012250 [Mortierella sp. AD031]
MQAQSKPLHPLDLPEIRILIASFLPRQGCVSCMLVCKEWFPDFVGQVWRVVDFWDPSTNHQLVRMTPGTVAKYSNHMEQILRLSIRKRIRVLKESSLDNVKTVTFDPYKSTSVRHVVSRGTLLPQSGELQLELPALFVHFPEVTKWAHFMRNLTDPDVSCEGLRAALAEVCSKLTRVHFQGNKPNLVSQMLSQAIARVKHLQITAMWYDPQLPFPSLYRFGSHLDHQDSLVTIEFTANGLEQVHSQPIASATIFNRVTRLSVRSHITTIEAFEDGEWVCRNLRILRVRVEGLNNKDDIDICLTDLKAARNTVEWWSSGDVIVVQGQTIEHRVNRQLLNLNRLQTVCMGTDDYYLAANGKRMGSGDGMGNRVKRQLLKQPKLNTVWLGTRTFALATK